MSTHRPKATRPTGGLPNVVVLRGTLSSDPRCRTLPSGDELWSYEVTTRDPAGRAESVPVVLGAARPPSGVSAGDEVVVLGHVRRRFYRAGGTTASRTEVVAERIVDARRRRSVAVSVAGAVEEITAMSEPVERGA